LREFEVRKGTVVVGYSQCHHPTSVILGLVPRIQGAATTAIDEIVIAAIVAFTAPVEFADDWVLGTSPRMTSGENAPTQTLAMVASAQASKFDP
jgi:hypothetical protein